MRLTIHRPDQRHTRRWLSMLGVALSLGLLLWITNRIAASFILDTTRLSQATSVCDIEPRAARSDNGQWLATAWIKRYMVNNWCVSGGDAVARWATEGAAKSGWADEVTLALPSGGCAVHTDIAVAGTTAHVAVSYWEPCNAANANSAIRYYTCNLQGASCTLQSTPVYQSGSENRRISDVRIAVDGNSRPHIVYARGTHSLNSGDILYIRNTGIAWAPPALVSTGDKIHGFYRPSIAIAQERLHIVWERHRNWSDGEGRTRRQGDVQYRYCEVATGNCLPSLPITYVYPPSLVATTYPLPTVAAMDGRVVIAWNVCADVTTNPPCRSFYLLYARSNSNGTSFFGPFEVGTERSVQNLNLSMQKYLGTDDSLEAGLVNSYATYTRAMLRMSDDQLPYIAWQVAQDQGYVITTTHAIAATETNFTWTPASSWQAGTGSDVRIAASLLLPDPSLDTNGIHLIYMKAWTESVFGQQAARSQIFYDYLGSRRATLQGNGAPSTHQLPGERGLPLRARVVDLTGTPIPGAQVTFQTDFGSFSYIGYGATTAYATSGVDGWAETTLYTNLPGSAQIRAWIDTTPDGIWQSTEPSVFLNRIWQQNTTPSLTTDAVWAMDGDLVAATLRNHPYEISSYRQHPAPYLLWLCARSGASGGTQVAGPLSTDVATWVLDNLPVRIPESTAAGRYVLESHLDPGLSEGLVSRPSGAQDTSTNLCGNPNRIAVSGEFEVRNAPPSGTPWILIDENQPYPGEALKATLVEHSQTTYDLWWCPASSNPTAVSAKVGSATVGAPPAHQPVAAIKVPMNATGFYRLESYAKDAGACGGSGRVGLSSLIYVNSRVLLPIVMRQARP